jgi:ribosome maturation factor RimP
MSGSLAVERTVTGMGYDLVDVERTGGGLLRVFIDRVPGRAYPTGESEFILIEDCEAVNRQLRYVLEVENVDFTRLEVSSPGVDRPLKRPADFERFTGSLAEVTFKEPFQGRKKFQGILQAREGGWRLVFEGQNPKAREKAKTENVEQVLDFTLEELREARLVPVLDFKGRKRHAPATPEAAPAGASEPPSDDGGLQQ